jgi:hypothetical protein
VMHFHSGPPMHLLSGVDISAVSSTKSSMPILILIPYVVSFLGCDDFVNGLLQMYRGTVGACNAGQRFDCLPARRREGSTKPRSITIIRGTGTTIAKPSGR